MAHTPKTSDPDVDGLSVETLQEDDVLRVVLHGVSDASVTPELDQALQDIELDGACLVHLDLTDLAFADVATIRRLAAFAGHVKRSGHDVRTCGAHHTVLTMADLLRVQDELGLS